MVLIDTRSPEPLYEQIKNSVRSQILYGVLTPDEKLPSVRELAAQAAINPNTIQKAYRDLEAEGLIYSVPGRGCFVAGPTEQVKENRINELVEAVRPLLAELKRLGVGHDALQERMKGGMNHDD